MSEQSTFDAPCLVELMGHRRVAAYVSEVIIAGHGMLRLQEPGVDGRAGPVHLVNAGSVYDMQPVTEERMLAAAPAWNRRAVEAWELPDAGRLRMLASRLRR